MKRANVYVGANLAGVLSEDDYGYEFRYLPDYLASGNAEAVSLTLPLSDKPYRGNVLFPFFDGLIPEGWLLDIAEQSWKITPAYDLLSTALVMPEDTEELALTLNGKKRKLTRTDF